MKQKMRYKAPAVRRVVPVHLKGSLLSGSVADHIEVISMGQDVEELDFSGDGFNHEWQ